MQDTFEETQEEFLNFQSELDKISEDIKTLENYLREMNVCIPLRVFVGKTYELEGSYLKFAEGPLSSEYCGPRRKAKLYSRALVWDLDDKGNYRILYECSAVNGEIEFVDKEFDGDDEHCLPDMFPDMNTETIERKPLLETKIDIRISMSHYLPDLLEEFVEQFGESRSNIEDDNALLEAFQEMQVQTRPKIGNLLFGRWKNQQKIEIQKTKVEDSHT